MFLDVGRGSRGSQRGAVAIVIIGVGIALDRGTGRTGLAAFAGDTAKIVVGVSGDFAATLDLYKFLYLIQCTIVVH